MQDILRQTGKSRLQAGLTAEEQYKRLMDNGIKLSKSQSITLGRGLTETEQQQLKEDAVLLVSKPVVLPDGTTQTVLVPTLYVAPTTKRANHATNATNGSIGNLQGASILLDVDIMHNSGSIVADNDAVIRGNDIHNDKGLIKGNTATVLSSGNIRNTQGTIEGHTKTTVYAKQDVINEGGRIKQTDKDGQLVVAAGRDVINNGKQYISSDTNIVWDDRNKRRETITSVDQGEIKGAGATLVQADRDVVMKAGTIQSDDSAFVTAKRNVELGTQDASLYVKEDHFHTGKSGGGHKLTIERHDEGTITNAIGSSIEGKQVHIAAANAADIIGSDILAKDKATIVADNVTFGTAKDSRVEKHSYEQKTKSIVSKEQTNKLSHINEKTVQGSTVSGKEIAIVSNNDVKGQSVALLGEKVTNVQAGGDVELGADKSVTDSDSAFRRKKSGVLGGAGFGFSVGKEKLNVDETSHEERTARNTIASTDGAVNIVAGGKVHVTSADIVSKEKSILDGAEVTLDGNTDNTHSSYAESYKKTGLTVSLGGALADNLTTATRTIKQAGGRDDKRLTALELNEARKQLQDGYTAVDKALKGAKIRDAKGNVEKVNGHSKRGQKNIDDAINLSVSIGSTSRKQSQVVDTNTYQGGTLVSEGDVHIISRDANSKGITLVGEQGQVKNITFDTASDLNLEAGKNTVDVTNKYKNSGWNVGASVSLTSGSLLDISASAHMARQNGDTHQESYVPTAIKAKDLAQIKAQHDSNIIGSTISAKKIKADIGNNLTIQSLQDVDNFKEHSKSGGFNISSKPNFMDPTGGISASVGRIDSKWRSVTNQAGLIAGEEGYDISVGNKTTLEGAVIKSTALKEKNKLSTKELEMKDIHNEAEYSYQNNGAGYTYYGSKQKLNDMKANDKKSYDKIYNNIGLVPNLGVGAKGKAESTTQSAISDGMIVVDGKQIDTNTINTNTEHTLNELNKIFDRKKIEERQELARLFAKNAYEQLHNWQPTTKDGKLAKSMAHGIVGEISARLAGNTPGSGFKATMTNEMLIGQIKQLAKNDPAAAQWISGALGALVNKATGESASAGAATASYATKWNEFEKDPILFQTLVNIHRNNYIVNIDGKDIDLRKMKDGAFYVIAVKDKVTNKYKNIAINNKLKLFDIVYEDGGRTSGLNNYFFEKDDVGKTYTPTTYSKIALIPGDSSSGNTGKTRRFTLTDYDGTLDDVIAHNKSDFTNVNWAWNRIKNFFAGLFRKNSTGQDGLTPSQRNALANYSSGIKPEYEYTTGVFFILNEDIPDGFLKDKDYLDAQYIAVGKNSEEEDLNTRGLGGKKMLKAAANRLLNKNVITRITDGTHMEVIDGVKVLKPNIEYEKLGATYRTNANRDITYANAVITKITPDNTRNLKAQRDIVEQTGVEGDHGGHLIARILGGSGDIDNLVSMSAWTNTSAYRIMENAVKKHVMAGRTVEITIVPNRSNSRRPDSFDVEYTVIETGEFNQMRIPNSKV